MAVIAASSAHLDQTIRAVDACVSKLLSLGIDQWDDEYPSRQIISAAIENQSLYVIVESESVVAAVGLDSEQPDEYQSCAWQSDDHALVVHHLLVHPNYWGKGYASRLMNFAESHVQALGASSIRLDAYKGNPAALSLYRTRSYSEVGEVTFPRRSLAFICFEKQVE